MTNASRIALIITIFGLMQATTSFGADLNDPRLRAAGLVVGVGFVLLASLFAGRFRSTSWSPPP